MARIFTYRWAVVAGALLLAVTMACTAKPEVVEVEKIVEVVKEVPVEVVVEKEVEKEVVREVPVETVMVKEVPVEKIVTEIKEIEKEIVKEVPIEVVVEKEVVRTIEVEKPVIVRQEVVKEVEVVREVEVEVVKEVEVVQEVEVIKEVPVEVEKIVKEVVQVPVSVPVEAAMSPDETGILMARQGTPKRGGTFKIGGWKLPGHFDLDQAVSVTSLFPQSPMYEKLLRMNPYDGGYTIIPDLAKSWEVSSDGLSYTFQLRNGVKFHDGSSLAARDVVATFLRRKDPPEGVVSIRKELYSKVTAVEEVDSKTVRFTLSAPQGFFIPAIANGWSVIYQKKVLDEHNGDLRRIPDYPGTGPFKFVEWTDEKIRTEANPDYWNPELPYVDAIERFGIHNSARSATLVLTGQLDFFEFATEDVYREALKQPDVVSTQGSPHSAAQTVLLNTTKSPMDDPRVRRALHLAVSRQDMQKAAAQNMSFFISRWAPPGEVSTPFHVVEALPGYRADKTRDIARAKELMDEAGYRYGIKGLKVLLRGGTPDTVITLSFLDQVKKALGVEFEVETAETSVYWDTVRKGDFHASGGASACGLADPSDCWSSWLKTGGPQNHSNFSNAEFDALLETIASTTDTAIRREFVSRGEQILDEEVPMVFVGWLTIRRIWGNDIRDLYFSQTGAYQIVRYDTVWLDR